MAFGPFNSQQGGEVISRFTKDELFPVTEKIRNLAIEISQFRAGFLESFLRNKIKKLEKLYKDLSVSFLNLYNKWNTPDILFKNLNIDFKNPQEFGPIMGDYFNSQQAVMWHFNEGFRLLNYIDDILTSQTTASYNRISISLSLLAIVISIILVIFFKK